MSSPPDGSRYERMLESRLWDEGWASFRVAGSGTIGHESADVAGIKSGRAVILEVKSSKLDNFPIDVSGDREQLEELYSRSVEIVENRGFNVDGKVVKSMVDVGFAVFIKNHDKWGWVDFRRNEIKMNELERMYKVLK